MGNKTHRRERESLRLQHESLKLIITRLEGSGFQSFLKLNFWRQESFPSSQEPCSNFLHKDIS